MKYAQSIYLGGEVIGAAEMIEFNGDPYIATRHYGLVCPCCKEAVFFRKEHFRGQIFVPSSFAHYKNDDPLNFDCENRTKGFQEKVYYDLNNEARKQRLDLFNKRFWDLVQPKLDPHKESSKTLKNLAAMFLTFVRFELSKILIFGRLKLKNSMKILRKD